MDSMDGLWAAACRTSRRRGAVAAIAPLPHLDEELFATLDLVMGSHEVGWHDVEDTLALYLFLLTSSETTEPGLHVYPSLSQAAAFLHSHRALQGRDERCDLCPAGLRGHKAVDVVPDAEATAVARLVAAAHPPITGTRETVLVYEWVMATSRLHWYGEERVYDDGTGAGRFLHQWRTDLGLEDADAVDACLLCASGDEVLEIA
ncbi:hypothetical protein [Nocardioides bruguierae]|uniref:Uncharacterized protein n=1 Tax=Nocardioides bruguierae TaxID=2945102 RepID=A0A9X2D622_9ACTN|nr:hypothetical protein [Nocardioides bruguierae]MCL8025844.1 hypothetical protein [Nocardioides bruguierae]MCM0618959.1 hypothetical protein [Nocardioides bruguierae]